MQPCHRGNGQIDDGKPRLTEDDITRAKLGPRGVPGEADPLRMTPRQKKDTTPDIDPGHPA